jgi:diacylglycerol kinase (ATP)
VTAALKEAGFNCQWLDCSSAEEATQRIAQWPQDATDALVVAGGDGTVFAAVNGLMQRPEADRWPLAILPVGTGNAFVRDLGLAPGDWQGGVAALRRGQLQTVDVGQVNSAAGDFWFINIIGVGFVEVAARQAQRLKWIGRSAYTLATLSALLRLKSYQLQLKLDNDSLAQDSLFLEVSNSRYTGTHFLMAPGASLQDGLLDVTLLRRLPRLRLLRLFPTIFDGRHVAEDEVHTCRVKELRIEAPAGLAATVDGEFVGLTPLHILCIPGALRVFSAG